MIKQFIALDKRKALRLALDYWYKNCAEGERLKDFVSCCSWSKNGIEYVVTYISPIEREKEKCR